ncbi:MAG: Wzz/FepE/Etk N-terminal domain-containing protein [Gammaproteobacteria bacterium]
MIPEYKVVDKDKEESPVSRLREEVPFRVPRNIPDNNIPDSDEVNLLDIWQVLKKYKTFIFIFSLLASLVAAIVFVTMEPVYRAETLLAPTESNRSTGFGSFFTQYSGLEDLASINTMFKNNSSAEAVAALKSRKLSDQFIKDENLMPILFSEAWDENNKRWKNLSEVPTEREAYDLFSSRIRKVNVDRNTGLVTLSIDWTDPQIAAEWANKLVERVNEKRREETILESETGIKYLTDQLENTSSVEIQQAIYRLIEAQQKTIMLAKSRGEFSFKVIDPAVVPEKQISPSHHLISLVFILSLIVSIGIAMIHHRIGSASSAG